MHTRFLSFSIVALLGVHATAMAQTAGTIPGRSDTAERGSAGLTALVTGPLGTRSPMGTVTIQGTVVRLAWSGDQPSTTRAWHIHKGSCRRDEGTLGGPGEYSSIIVGSDSIGSATATLGATLSDDGTYFVDVHAAATAETNTSSIACGALTNGRRNGAEAGQQMPGDMSRMSPGLKSGQTTGTSTSTNAGMDHSMDHSTMRMPTLQSAPDSERIDRVRMGRTPPGTQPGAVDMSSLIMEMHARLLADSVIRRRVLGDTAMRRLLADMTQQMTPEDRAMMSQLTSRASGGSASRTQRRVPKPATSTEPGRAAPAAPSGHEGMDMPGMNMPAKKPKAAPRKPAAKPPKDSMPGMDMKGLDHGAMKKPLTAPSIP